MKQSFLRKVIVYAASILIVCGVIGGIFSLKILKERAEQKALEASYAAPKPVMTQEEMEALYDEHKKEESVVKERVEEPTEEAITEEAVEESIEEVAVQEASESKEAEAVYEGCPVDFAGMWKVNPDVYAWITVPGTVIDYPILQHPSDNTYYLNYNIDGSYGYPGCIYTENMNSKEFTDNNTVIYGHNMRHDDKIFGTLEQYREIDGFKKAPFITMNTLYGEYKFKIYAVFISNSKASDDNGHVFNYIFNEATNARFKEYIEEIDKRKLYTTGVDINENPDAYNANMNTLSGMQAYLINFSDPLCGFNPDEDVEGVKMADLGDFVGSNTHYYLPIFKRIKETGHSFSWNFCAMIFPELYFSYRKMPLIALAAWVGRIVSQIPQTIAMIKQVGNLGILSEMVDPINVTSDAFRGVIMIGYVIFYSLMFLLGFNANKFYFRSAVNKIKKVKAKSDGRDTRGEIVRKGGTSAILLVTFILLMTLPSLIMYFIQLVPAMGLL